MSRILMALGVFLFIAGSILFFLGANTLSPSFDLPSGSLGANDTVAIDPERINEALAQAERRANELNTSGVAYQAWARWALFAVFVAGAAVAFLSGLQRMFDELDRRMSGLTITIGLLGSLSAVSSYAAGYFDAQAEGTFACIAVIEKEVRLSLVDIRGEPDATLAGNYLSEMRRTIQRCPS